MESPLSLTLSDQDLLRTIMTEEGTPFVQHDEAGPSHQRSFAPNASLESSRGQRERREG